MGLLNGLLGMMISPAATLLSQKNNNHYDPAPAPTPMAPTPQAPLGAAERIAGLRQHLGNTLQDMQEGGPETRRADHLAMRQAMQDWHGQRPVRTADMDAAAFRAALHAWRELNPHRRNREGGQPGLPGTPPGTTPGTPGVPPVGVPPILPPDIPTF